MLNRDKIAGLNKKKKLTAWKWNNIYFCEEELRRAVGGQQNNKASCRKEEAKSDFRKTLMKLLYEKGDKSECGSYSCYQISVAIQLLDTTVHVKQML